MTFNLKNRFMMPLIVSVLFGLTYIFCIKFGHEELFILLLIIGIIWFIGWKPKEEKEVPTNQFEGYVCERCGAEYNCCEHSTLEDYTLVKKA